jgi:methionyl-tRNA synthetase
MSNRLYLTTAIPFVNGAPHLGHALEYVQTDVLARHARARGRAVRLLTGTDEHAAKNVQAAHAAGEDVTGFVARNAAGFRVLADALDVSYDDFLRTSADPRHQPAVEAIWRRCVEAGDLYRERYAGWYCPGCEEFSDPDLLPGGRCPEHDAPLERVEEENWFFRLSHYRETLTELIGSGRLRIEPDARRNEVLGFLSGPVRDISVSRPRARVHGWGVPVPGDPEQTVYVWFDALTNYVSALGYGGADPAPYREWWCDSERRVHVIGKGIVRFHAVIWPAILRSAGQPLPSTLLVHDYVTANGRKIGKSLGNAVDPSALLDRYGVDALRWWLCREVPRVGETDFTDDRLIDASDRDLANGVGNLVQRTVTLAAKAFGDRPVGAVAAGELVAACDATRERIDTALDGFDLRGATEALVGLVDVANRYVEATRPWTLLRGDDLDEARAVLGRLVGAVRVIGAELEPFVPALAARARARIGDPGDPVAPGAPIQPRLGGSARVGP